MTDQRWLRMATRAALAAAVAAWAVPGAARAQDTAPAATDAATRVAVTTSPAPSLGEIETLARAVRDPTGLPIDRDEAARRLVARQSEEPAVRAINIGLVDQNRPAQAALARALAEDPRPNPVFVAGLRTIVSAGRDPDSAEPATVALAKFPDERPLLAAIAGGSDPSARNRPGQVRAAILRGLGTLTDKRTAELLAGVALGDAEPSSVVRNGAFDGLARMTGQHDIGRDPEQWQQWWVENRGKPDDQFEAAIAAARSSRLVLARADHERLAGEVTSLLKIQYRQAPDAAKGETLSRYLRSGAPEVRAVALELIRELFNEAQPIPPEAQDQLSALVGDSSTDVRLSATLLLRDLNESSALQPLLDQVARETDPDVRAAQAAALGPMGDLRAVPVLLRLIRDPAPAVVESAARSLRDLGDKLAREDPRGAERAAEAIRDVLRAPDAPKQPGIRAALLDAAAPLASREMLNVYIEMIRVNQPPVVRQSALRALGALKDRGAASMVIDSGALEDPSTAVREAAVDALAMSAMPVHADRIFERLNPNNEKVEEIRDKVWNHVLVRLFPEFSPAELNRWADWFPTQPPAQAYRKLTILENLEAKLAKATDAPALAVTRQNIGTTYMELGEYDDAAAKFEQALEHYKGREDQPQVTQLLVTQLTRAYLAGKQYEKAARFAGERIAQSPSYQETMGPLMRNEAQRLLQDGQLEDALRLIEQATRMQPPLNGRFVDELRGIERDVRRRIAEREKAPASAIEPAASRPFPAAAVAVTTVAL